jgi:hypothetical protein
MQPTRSKPAQGPVEAFTHQARIGPEDLPDGDL